MNYNCPNLTNCDVLTERGCGIIGDLSQLDCHLHENDKMTLVYICCYVVHDYDHVDNDAHMINSKYGLYGDAVCRGLLKVPGASACHWIFLFHCFSLSS